MQRKKRFYKAILLSNSNIALEYWLRLSFSLNLPADLLHKVKQVFYVTFCRWLFTVSWHSCQIFHIGLSARHCSLLYSEFRRFLGIFWFIKVFKKNLILKKTQLLHFDFWWNYSSSLSLLIKRSCIKTWKCFQIFWPTV